jgi:hypothetical protein
MRLDPLIPRAEKATLVFEAIGDDKVRVNSASLGSPLVMLANQASEVVAFGKRLRVCQAPGSAVFLNIAPRPFPRQATGRQRSKRMLHATCDMPQGRKRCCGRHRLSACVQRRRQGKHSIRLLVKEDEVDFLLARGYPLNRTDNGSIAEAVSAYLADSVMEGAWATN